MLFLIHPAVASGSFWGHIATNQHTEWGSPQETTQGKVGALKYTAWSLLFPSLGFRVREVINSPTC